MLGFDLNVKAKLVETQLDTVILEIVKTSEIEDETVNNGQVRSSVAQHLGVDDASTLLATREMINVIVEMMLSATYHY